MADSHQAKETKTGHVTRQHARQQGAAPRPGPRPSHAVPPQSQTPGAHQQHHPHQRPPPPPYHSTLPWQPSQGPTPAQINAIPGPPFTQGQGTWHHQHHHHAPAPPDPYPQMPQYYRDPHQLHHHHAPARSVPTGHPAHAAQHTAPQHHVYHGHTHHHDQPLPPKPPAPWDHTQPTHPHHQHHTVQHHILPPLHRLTTFGPPYAPMEVGR